MSGRVLIALTVAQAGALVALQAGRSIPAADGRARRRIEHVLRERGYTDGARLTDLGRAAAELARLRLARRSTG